MVDLSDNLGRDILMISRLFTGSLAKKCEPLGIGAGQVSYILTLYYNDGQSQQELSDRLRLNKAATARSINKLVEAGLVKRVPDPKDQRCVNVYLTDQGRSAQKKLAEAVADTVLAMNQGFSEEEQLHIRSLMRRIWDNLDSASRVE